MNIQAIAMFSVFFGTMFSGSAVIDKNNVLGMKVNDHNPLVLFYTASGGERSETAKGNPFTQCMAVSTDGGRNFVKYKNNPIIGEEYEMPYTGELKIYTDNLGYDIFSSDLYYAGYCTVSDYKQNTLEFGGDTVFEKLEWGHSFFIK